MSTNAMLTRKTKLAYGAGDLGAAITAAIVGFFMNAFLLEVAGLRPGVVGIIFFVSTLWDAITDPIVGNWSDRTRSRWGRRRPWLLFGAIPFGIAFWLHWLVPDMDANGLFIYYLVVALLLKTAFTAVNIPYTSLTPELTSDYNERTSLTAYRFSFSILGGVTAVGLHPVIVGMFGTDIKTGYMVSAGLWAIFIVLSAWTTFFFTREQEHATPEKRYGFIEGIRITFQNKAFLYVTGIYLLSWLTIQFVQTNLLLYVRYWSGGEENFTLLVLILQVTAFLFLGVWSWVSGRVGKKRTYYIGITIWAVVLAGVFLIPRDMFAPLILVSFLAGTGVSVAYLIPWSMLPDVIELDELETGQRREGVYYGFFVFLQKLGLSVGLGLSNVMLEWAGYINPTSAGEIVAQPDNVLLVLRLFISLLPAVILVLSLPLAVAYPITPERFAEIQTELAKRRQG